MSRDRHPTHGHDHSYAHGLSAGQIAAIKAKGGYQPAGKGALPKNVAVPRSTTNRVNNPAVPGVAPKRAMPAPMTKKQVAARPVPKPKAPPVKTPVAAKAKTTVKHAPKQAGHKSHVSVGNILKRAGAAAVSAAEAAAAGAGAEPVIKHKKGGH